MDLVVYRRKFEKGCVLEVRSEGALEIENGYVFRLKGGLVEGESKVNR